MRLTRVCCFASAVGLGPAVTFATVGAATMYGAIKVKQRYHPAPFNPSIKELYEWVVKKNGDA